jgi:galactonate dehydratase
VSQRLPYAKIIAQLKANTRHVAGGIAQQAIAAIENALLDVVGKAYNVPVCALFGGPIRTKIPVYWSHCGSFRASYGDMLVTVDGTPTAPLRSLDDIRALGAEVKSSGHTSLKTNMFIFDPAGGPARLHMPGFGGGVGSPELNAESSLIAAVVEQMRTLREGAGPNVSMKLDLNYNFKTDGFIAMAKALTPEAVGAAGIDWLELDIYCPRALRQIRDAAPMPIASLESLYGRRQLLPYLEAGSVDVCIVDPLWNGVDESVGNVACVGAHLAKQSTRLYP